MYTSTSLPSLSLHLGNLPGFEFSSDRETPISNPPSSVFSATSSTSSALSSASISPLSLLSATPVNHSLQVCQQKGTNSLPHRASTLPNLPSAPRMPPPQQSVLPEGFQKCSFVDSLVGQRSLASSLNARYWCFDHRDHLAKPNYSYLELEDPPPPSIHPRNYPSIPHLLFHPPTSSILSSSHQVSRSRLRGEES